MSAAVMVSPAPVVLSTVTVGAAAKSTASRVASSAPCAPREAVLFAAAPTVTVLNTTGAEDTMTAARIYARLHGLTPEETLRFAVAAATAKVVRAGTQPPVMSDIGALQPQVEVRSI